jgi:hypothetical protein
MRAETMIKAIFAVCAVIIAATPATAQDFSEGSKANSWNLAGEEKAKFSGKVVDILCELAGDCADQCGGGVRQLGIVRSSDNALIPVLKNGQPLFNGAIPDLMPYCGAMVDVDGLLIKDETAGGPGFYQIQLIRREGEAEFQKANLWTRKWDEDHPEQAGKDGPWFRRDPAIANQIEKDGYFGIGAEADKKYIEENF